MRRAARVDANQSAVVAALRQIGASVQPLHTIGQGCPDILVGYRGRNLVIEIKNGDRSPSRRKLTTDELEWRDNWRGRVDIVTSPQEAIALALSVASGDTT